MDREVTPSHLLAAGGAPLRVERLVKDYGRVRAVDDVSLSCAAGEFLALLGPSGSGKTSILMAIAGFEHPDAGDISIDGVSITHLPPNRRDIGVVFQSYALFPHMSVRNNVAFPLAMRRTPKAMRDDEVDAALDLVQLTDQADKLPGQLSGGQQQRVAIARAVVFRPKLLLMDEPLGALDRRLREDMQVEIKRLQRRLGATIVYVTHDQDEAMLMADRIAVLRNGKLEQIDPPEVMYERPVNPFVADFIGQMNLIEGSVVACGDDACDVAVSGEAVMRASISDAAGSLAAGDAARIAVRQDRVRLQASAATGVHTALRGVVADSLYVGGVRLYFVELPDGQVVKVRSPVDRASATLSRGDAVDLAWSVAHAHVFGRPS